MTGKAECKMGLFFGAWYYVPLARLRLIILRQTGQRSCRTWMRIRHAFEVTMRTQGEIEAAICDGIGRFEQDYMGRGPKDIHAHLIGDLILVRLQGVLTAAEQQLVKALPAEKGRDLLKQVRTHLIETARPVMEAMVQEVTGVAVLSVHHDISTVTGEEVVLFTLSESPYLRQTKKK
jgi:uncharacterized protein YbcI